MIRSRVFGFLAITLFLANCLCAHAVEDENTKTKAVQDVKILQELTAGVLGTAKTKLTKAESVETNVELQKRKADSAESDARTAAETIKEVKRKGEAKAVAQKAKEELAKCDTLYQNAKEKAAQAYKDMNAFLKRARDLNNKSKIEIQDAPGESGNYAQVIASAADFKTKTTTLSGEIGASRVLSDADTLLTLLTDGAKKVSVFKYQAESLVVVSNIEAKISEAQTDIQNIQRKREEINTIVEAMNKSFKSASITSSSLLSSLCINAESQLRTATNKVTEAKSSNTKIMTRKTQLDGTLATLMTSTDQTSADRESKNVQWHAGDINGELQKIKQALQTAEIAFRSAKKVQQQMQNEISPKRSQSGSKINNGKQQDNGPTEDVTNSIRSGEEKNPKITETENTILGKSEDTMDKTSDQSVDANLDNTEQNKLAQLTHKDKQNPKDGNSALLNNDKLREITKDITNNPLIGGEVPTRSAENDSAVTVFIPLLVILVMSAVLH